MIFRYLHFAYPIIKKHSSLGVRSVFVGSGVYPLLLHVGLGALRHQIVSDRRREEDRGGRTYDHADDQREDEAADRLAAEEEDGQQRHERRA